MNSIYFYIGKRPAAGGGVDVICYGCIDRGRRTEIETQRDIDATHMEYDILDTQYQYEQAIKKWESLAGVTVYRYDIPNGDVPPRKKDTMKTTKNICNAINSDIADGRIVVIDRDNQHEQIYGAIPLDGVQVVIMSKDGHIRLESIAGSIIHSYMPGAKDSMTILYG